MYYIINLLGSPGVGKSTLATELFQKFKKKGFIVEYVNEFAKDLVYKKNNECLKNQVFVLGNQHHKIWSILNYYKQNNIKNAVIITDSPLILGLLYNRSKNPLLNSFYIKEFNNYYPFNVRNINILLKPNEKIYEKIGRLHSLKESKIIYKKLKLLLNNNNINYKKGTYKEMKNYLFKIFQNQKIMKNRKNH